MRISESVDHEGDIPSRIYFCGFGDTLTKDLNLDVTEGRMKGDRHSSRQKLTLLVFQRRRFRGFREFRGFRVNGCRMNDDN